MEALCDLYEEPDDPRRPRVCFDERPFQLTEEVVTPLPSKPGRKARHDYEYERKGVCNLFVYSDPFRGWRRIEATEHRTKRDFAHCLKRLVDELYPNAEKIRLVLDNLNIHRVSVLYESFPPEEARRIIRKLELHPTPVHGSWLNMAEIELSVLARQCLNRRIPDIPALQTELDAWQDRRNREQVAVQWRFTTKDARIKMKQLYPIYSKEST